MTPDESARSNQASHQAPGRSRRARVLFVAEAVTLAHVARVHALAQRLDATAYEVCVAADPRYDELVGSPSFATRPIESIASSRFAAALRKGTPIYDVSTLERYVEDDRRAIEAFDPEVVVGDFRLSLGVAARLSGKPYLAITNAGWSRYARTRFVVPDLPIVDWFGVPLAQRLFDLARPLAFRRHAAAMNTVRRRHRLPPLAADLRDVYTDGDFVLYADVPELFPTTALPPTHRFVGAVPWDPDRALPDWWRSLPSDRPIVYVSLGSSGDTAVLQTILDGLAMLPVRVVAATAGRSTWSRLPADAFVADFLPGSTICKRASLVICNGGSPTSYQALAEGVPVLGMPSNLDQFINMTAVEDFGAGCLLRPGRASARSIASCATALLERPGFRVAARTLQDSIRRHHPGEILAETIEAALAYRTV